MKNASYLRIRASMLAMTAFALAATPAFAQTPPSTGSTEPLMPNATGPDTPKTQAPPPNAAPTLNSATNPNASPDQNAIVITGTSIRGVQPVGANLISIGPKEIAATGAQTLTQILATVPALSSMGNAGQGEVRGSYYQPQIHQLGGSASSSTLVLIDGHRTSPGGTNHTNTDPGIVPINMIERVEVLPEGASSTYGSDAVAGVVNFITRNRFNGVQLGGQYGFADGTHSWQGSALAGKSWTMARSSWPTLTQNRRRSPPLTGPIPVPISARVAGRTSTASTAVRRRSSRAAPARSSSARLPALASPTRPRTRRAAPGPSPAFCPPRSATTSWRRARSGFPDQLTLSGDVVYGVRRTVSDIARGTLRHPRFRRAARQTRST